MEKVVKTSLSPDTAKTAAKSAKSLTPKDKAKTTETATVKANPIIKTSPNGPILARRLLTNYPLLILLSLFVMLISLGLTGKESSYGYAKLLEFLKNPQDTTLYTMYMTIKAPRIVLAFLVGALLASSGVVVQSVFLNPLADPYIIGIASAATFGAVLAYLIGLSDFYYGIFAFAASIALSLFILSLYRRGQSITTLLILGIAIAAFLGAFTSFAIYLIGQDSFKITAWMMGYLGSASWYKISLVIAPLIVCIAFFYYKRYELDILLCGDEEALSLGLNAQRLKKQLLITASLAVAYSVAFTGMIGFVGLIIPHILRLFLRTSSNALLIPASCFFGGIFLLCCDDLARSIIYPVEIPIGIITAFFGAPFFMFLALRFRG